MPFFQYMISSTSFEQFQVSCRVKMVKKKSTAADQEGAKLTWLNAHHFAVRFLFPKRESFWRVYGHDPTVNFSFFLLPPSPQLSVRNKHGLISLSCHPHRFYYLTHMWTITYNNNVRAGHIPSQRDVSISP